MRLPSSKGKRQFVKHTRPLGDVIVVGKMQRGWMLSVKLVGLHASPVRTLLTFITRNKTAEHVEGLLSDRENQDYSAKPCRACKRIKVSLWTMDSTNVLVYWIYKNAFEFFNIGEASAGAYILFLIILLLTVLQWKTRKKWVFNE